MTATTGRCMPLFGAVTAAAMRTVLYKCRWPRSHNPSRVSCTALASASIPMASVSSSISRRPMMRCRAGKFLAGARRISIAPVPGDRRRTLLLPRAKRRCKSRQLRLGEPSTNRRSSSIRLGTRYRTRRTSSPRTARYAKAVAPRIAGSRSSPQRRARNSTVPSHGLSSRERSGQEPGAPRSSTRHTPIAVNRRSSAAKSRPVSRYRPR